MITSRMHSLDGYLDQKNSRPARWTSEAITCPLTLCTRLHHSSVLQAAVALARDQTTALVGHSPFLPGAQRTWCVVSCILLTTAVQTSIFFLCLCLSSLAVKLVWHSP